MSVLRMVVNWSARWQREFNIPKGFLLVRYHQKYRKNVGKALGKLDGDQEKRILDLQTGVIWEEALRDIDMVMEIHYQKRTLKQNDLMWALYEIEANELNAGRKSADMETPEHIYQQDMEYFAPKMELQLKPEQVEILRRTYSMVKEVSRVEDKVAVVVTITSSHWNSKEMHDHLEMQFDRLSEAGVDLKASADISHYWFDWRQKLNDDKYLLHDEEYTTDQYRDLVKNCEACGQAVWHEDVGSSVAHVKSVGMGGHRLYKYHGSELMHLCDTDHAMYDNGQGKDKFLEEYPHLRYKVETGLRREVKAPKEPQEADDVGIY